MGRQPWDTTARTGHSGPSRHADGTVRWWTCPVQGPPVPTRAGGRPRPSLRSPATIRATLGGEVASDSSVVERVGLAHGRDGALGRFEPSSARPSTVRPAEMRTGARRRRAGPPNTARAGPSSTSRPPPSTATGGGADQHVPAPRSGLDARRRCRRARRCGARDEDDGQVGRVPIVSRSWRRPPRRWRGWRRVLETGGGERAGRSHRRQQRERHDDDRAQVETAVRLDGAVVGELELGRAPGGS